MIIIFIIVLLYFITGTLFAGIVTGFDDPNNKDKNDISDITFIVIIWPIVLIAFAFIGIFNLSRKLGKLLSKNKQ